MIFDGFQDKLKIELLGASLFILLNYPLKKSFIFPTTAKKTFKSDFELLRKCTYVHSLKKVFKLKRKSEINYLKLNCS